MQISQDSEFTGMEKLLLRSKYNLEIESLQFKYLVAQETIEQLRQELKQKEIFHSKQQNSGGIFNSFKRHLKVHHHFETPCKKRSNRNQQTE